MLLTTATFITLMSTAIGLAYLATTNLALNTARTRTLQSAMAVGDAYIESAFAQWRTTARSHGTAGRPASAFNPLTPPDASLLVEPYNYTASNFKISTLSLTGAVQGDSVAPVRAQGEDENGSAFQYVASVDIEAPVRNGTVNARVRRVFEKRIESPWKYAIFYNDVLEIHPSPHFQVSGPVHTNDDLYAAPDGGNPLIFKDRVTHADRKLQGYAPGNWAWRGRPNENGAAPTYATPPTLETRKDFAGITPTQFTGTNPNLEGYRELIERPNTSHADPLTNASGDNPRLYNQADIKILVNASNQVTILKKNGTQVTNAPNASAADKAIYNAVIGAISTNQTIQDYRESANVRLVTLDIGELKTSTLSNFEGLIYVSDTSAGQSGTGNKRGVRLRNGAKLPEGGLTIVSDNPVYVQGNYNTSGTRQPAAIMGDAIMVLSQNWNDANSSATLTSGKRNATNTTINAAFLGGIVPTNASFSGGSAYSGGVENFPRFMENWSGVTFTYNGSMVQLFNSKQAIGRWNNSQAYSAPIRNWAFDTIFRTNPPPGFLTTVTYLKQRWYLE